MKIGDRVRFLNDVGGGVIVGEGKNGDLLVEQQDGFVFPVAASQCVLISRSEPNDEPQKASSSDEGVYLALIPSDLNRLAECPQRVYIVNNSAHSLHIVVSAAKGDQYQSLCACTVPSRQRHLVVELSRQRLLDLKRLHLQAIQFKSAGTFTPQPPIERTVDLNHTKLTKPQSYPYSIGVGSEAYAIELTPRSKSTLDESLDLTALKSAMREKVSTPKKSASSNRVTPQLLEVDLHIDKLLDTTSGMNNGNILEYQLDTLRSTLEKHASQRGVKIVFIHGKGDGILRSAITKELNRRQLRHEAASFKRYGSGAIVVTM